MNRKAGNVDMELVIKKFEELSVYELYEILQARSAVFVVEQTCPYQDMDNKDKGAFYTPTEIVRYMCQESLIAYLETNTSIAKEKSCARFFQK